MSNKYKRQYQNHVYYVIRLFYGDIKMLKSMKIDLAKQISELKKLQASNCIQYRSRQFLQSKQDLIDKYTYLILFINYFERKTFSCKVPYLPRMIEYIQSCLDKRSEYGAVNSKYSSHVIEVSYSDLEFWTYLSRR